MCLHKTDQRKPDLCGKGCQREFWLSTTHRGTQCSWHLSHLCGLSLTSYTVNKNQVICDAVCSILRCEVCCSVIRGTQSTLCVFFFSVARPLEQKNLSRSCVLVSSLFYFFTQRVLVSAFISFEMELGNDMCSLWDSTIKTSIGLHIVVMKFGLFGMLSCAECLNILFLKNSKHLRNVNDSSGRQKEALIPFRLIIACIMHTCVFAYDLHDMISNTDHFLEKAVLGMLQWFKSSFFSCSWETC